MSGTPAIKILLVDDLEENLMAMQALLQSEGLELLSAHSGREALELLLVHEVALALLDVQMPEMDGFELAELMRGSERTARVPIIFVTAGSREARRVFRGYEVGAVDFLFKPIDPVLLGHKVSTFVELHRQRLEQLRQANESREMLKLNEMFVAAVSHDLRSPLSTVMTGVSLLEHALVDPAARRTLARVRSSAARMTGMLDQLYDLARARLGGGLAITPRETDFRGLADKAIEELRVVHPDRSVILDCAGPMTGRWDEARLAQVLTNLIGNALSHGANAGEVRVLARGSPESLAVEVHNQGEIAADVRPQLFEPFRRGAQGKRDGLGLGLFIVQQIVLAHAGTIEVRSSSEAGTAFRIDLPRQ